jgi:hypothetical protein
MEGGDGFLKKVEGDPQIQKGGTEHVAADAGGAVEMEMGGRHVERID